MSTQLGFDPKKLRQDRDLTQQEAAARAGVSLATWRRWEADPTSVSDTAAAACSRALMTQSSAFDLAPRWSDDPKITARQIAALVGTLSWWADMDLAEWLQDDRRGPLHEIGPFRYLDRRVMMLISDNTAFADLAREHCASLAEEIAHGLLPFEREGCFFDEVVVAAALVEAPTLAEDEGFFDGSIPATSGTDIAGIELDDVDWDTYRIGDDNWESVTDNFDDLALWRDWEVPVYGGHPLLPLLLERHHPFRWFDVAPSAGDIQERKLRILSSAPHDLADDPVD